MRSDPMTGGSPKKQVTEERCQKQRTARSEVTPEACLMSSKNIKKVGGLRPGERGEEK